MWPSERGWALVTMPVFDASRCTSRIGSCVAIPTRPDSASATRAEPSATICNTTSLIRPPPPVLAEPSQPGARAALVLHHPVGAGADRLGVEALGSHLLHVGPGHHVDGKKGQVDRGG